MLAAEEHARIHAPAAHTSSALGAVSDPSSAAFCERAREREWRGRPDRPRRPPLHTRQDDGDAQARLPGHEGEKKSVCLTREARFKGAGVASAARGEGIHAPLLLTHTTSPHNERLHTHTHKNKQSVKDMPILQDVPPPGGFPAIRIQRRLPSTGPTGVTIFAVGAAVMAYGYYRVSSCWSAEQSRAAAGAGAWERRGVSVGARRSCATPPTPVNTQKKRRSAATHSYFILATNQTNTKQKHKQPTKMYGMIQDRKAVRREYEQAKAAMLPVLQAEADIACVFLLCFLVFACFCWLCLFLFVVCVCVCCSHDRLSPRLALSRDDTGCCDDTHTTNKQNTTRLVAALRREREEEARVMAKVPGWVVGESNSATGRWIPLPRPVGIWDPVVQ